MNFLKQYISKSRNQVSRVVDKETVIIVRELGGLDTVKRKVVILNPQTALIWESLRKEMTVGDLVRLAAKALRVEYKETRKEIEACISRFVKAGLVTLSTARKYDKKGGYREISKVGKIYSK